MARFLLVPLICHENVRLLAYISFLGSYKAASRSGDAWSVPLFGAVQQKLMLKHGRCHAVSAKLRTDSTSLINIWVPLRGTGHTGRLWLNPAS